MIDVAAFKANCSPGVENYHVYERSYVTGSQDVIRLILFVVVHGDREPAPHHRYVTAGICPYFYSGMGH